MVLIMIINQIFYFLISSYVQIQTPDFIRCHPDTENKFSKKLNTCTIRVRVQSKHNKKMNEIFQTKIFCIFFQFHSFEKIWLCFQTF